jgi:hypothetical protein
MAAWLLGKFKSLQIDIKSAFCSSFAFTLYFLWAVMALPVPFFLQWTLMSLAVST